jgi:cardiolipin synthase
MFVAHWNAQSKRPFAFDNPPEEIAAAEGRGCVIPFGDGPQPIYREPIGKHVYMNMIHGAEKYLYITTPYLICDHEMLSALALAARKGVDVRLLTPHISDNETVFLMTRSNYRPLLEAGVKIYEYTPGFIHAKNFVCDDVLAVCGTINLDYRSLEHHFECGVWMYNTDCIGDMKRDFLQTQEVSQPVTAEIATLRGIRRLVAEVLKVLSPLL